MQHNRPTPGIRDRASAYALGILESRQALTFEDHLRSGCSICEAELRAAQGTVVLLALSVPESTPPPHLRERILGQVASVSERKETPQIWKDWRAFTIEGKHVVRADQADWQSVGLEGVTAKRLYIDTVRDSVTMLVRMAPGSAYPGHRHGGFEQCFVIEGDLTQDVTLRAGDYVCAEANTVHPISRTEHGCLLLIISSMHDELIA